MTGAGEKRHVVRVRWQRGAVTSQLMSGADASHLVESVLVDVADCGTGDGFVRFTGHDGRTVHIRGREVVVVEKIPDNPDRMPPSTTGAARGAPLTSGGVQVHVQGTVPAPGTAFLRHLAEAERMHS